MISKRSWLKPSEYKKRVDNLRCRKRSPVGADALELNLPG